MFSDETKMVIGRVARVMATPELKALCEPKLDRDYGMADEVTDLMVGFEFLWWHGTPESYAEMEKALDENIWPEVRHAVREIVAEAIEDLDL